MAEQNTLTSKTHAVMKLQLGERGGTRRINFSRLWDVSRNSVSYSKLFSLAVEYSFPEDAPIDLSNYDIVITYLDEDGDTITVSSDDELSEAFMQFVGKSPPILRATAKVKRTAEVQKEEEEVKASKEEPTSTPSPEGTEKPTITPGDEHTGPSRQPSSIPGEFAGSSGQINEPPAVVVLKGIASILTSVLSPHPNQTTSASSTREQGATGSTAPTTTGSGEEAERFVREVIEKISLAGSEGARAAAATAATAAATATASATASSDSAKQPRPSLEGIDRDFIHGHHTCDGCRAKPIVGIRYHATDKPDYDLCEACFEQEDSSAQVNFEARQFDRDRPHQARWQNLRSQKAAEEEAKEASAPQKSGSESTADKSPANADGSSKSFIHGRHTCDGCLTTPIVGLRWHAVNLPDYDLCDKCIANYKGEDITFEPMELDRDRFLQPRWQRRQIRRARQARFACGHHPGMRFSCNQQQGNAHQVMDVALKEAIRRSLLDSVSNHTVPTKNSSPESQKEASASPKCESDHNAEGKPTPTSEGKKGHSSENAEAAMSLSSPHTPPGSPAPAKVEAKDVVLTPTTRNHEGVGKDNKPTTPASAKTNFSEEAEAVGDELAVAIGATLDNCAQALDQIVTEFDMADALSSAVGAARVAASAASVASSVAETLDDQQGANLVDDGVSTMTMSVPSISTVDEQKGGQEEEEEAAGKFKEDKKGEGPSDVKEADAVEKDAAAATVEAGDDEDAAKANAAEDEWEVVGDDDLLARATENLGTALYESQHSNPDGSSGGDIDSLPSSIPTLEPSSGLVN